MLGLTLLALAAVTSCGRGGGAAAPTEPTVVASAPTTATTRAPTTETTVAPDTTATTTTAPRPSAPRRSPAAASGALIAAWEAGRRSAAASVATGAAVATLFTTPYAGEPLNNRGCSSSRPSVCSWGPYAGASPADALYQVTVEADGPSWYVSSVVVEH